VTVIDYDRVGGNEPIGEKNKDFFACLVINICLLKLKELWHEIRQDFLVTNKLYAIFRDNMTIQCLIL
jgi:hypothetical protein